MNRSIPNRKITANFSLYEFIEAQLPNIAVDLNWKHINEMNIRNYEFLAGFLQTLRDDINQTYQKHNNNKAINLTVTSGFRCKEWEHTRKRTGESQHCVGAAADVQPTNCSLKLSAKIMNDYYKLFSPSTGWHGGFAIKLPEYDSKGNVLKPGFLHFDLRGSYARWTY